MVSDSSRLWTGRFVLAMLTNFSTMMTFYILITSMALYAVERFNASDSLAGFASGAFVFGSILARLLTGKFLDFIGRRRLLVTVLTGFLLISLAYLLANSLVLLLVVRFLHGLTFGAASTTLSASVVTFIPRRRRSEGIGYYGMAMTTAAALGPFVALLVKGPFGFEAVLLGGSAFAAAATAFSLGLRLPERTPGPEEVARKWHLHPKDLLEKSVLPIGTVMFVIAIGFSSVLTFVNSYGRAEHMVAATSLFFIVYAGALALSRLTVGRLQDRRGDNTLFYPALVLFAIGIVVLAIATDGLLIAAAAVLIGFGYGSTLTGGQSIAVTMAPEHRTGLAVSTYLISIDVGIGLGPVILGALIPWLGYRGMYSVVAAVIVIGVIIYHFVHGRKRHGGRRA